MRLGEHARGLLEGGGAQPGVRGQRGLGDSHELGTAGGGLTALGHDPTVLGTVVQC